MKKDNVKTKYEETEQKSQPFALSPRIESNETWKWFNFMGNNNNNNNKTVSHEQMRKKRNEDDTKLRKIFYMSFPSGNFSNA